MSLNSFVDKVRQFLLDANEKNSSVGTATFKLDDIGTIQFTPLIVNHTSYYVAKYSALFEESIPEWKIAAIFFYCLIILVSLFGNFIVCKVVFCSPAMRSTTNIFIGSLSISDLLMTIINIPLRLTREFSSSWPLGQFFCRCLPFFQGLSVNVSSFTMACIAFDRYGVIAHPLKPRLTMKSIIFKLTFIWILAAVVSFPYAALSDLQEDLSHRYTIVTRCRLIYPEPEKKVRQILTLVLMTIQYLVPLTIAGFLYSKICYIMWNRRSVGIMSERQINLRYVAKWRTIKMLIIVLVVFAICWFPLNIYHTYQDFRSIDDINKHKSSIELMSHCFAMSSVCYNPFIYCWLNDRFKNKARSVLSWFLRFTPKSYSSNIHSRNSNLQQINLKHSTKSSKVSYVSINTSSKYSNNPDLALLHTTKNSDHKSEKKEGFSSKLKVRAISTANVIDKKSTKSEFVPIVHKNFKSEAETEV